MQTQDSTPHSVWVTATEYARMMGKSRMWANRVIHNGLLAEVGIPVMMIDSPQTQGHSICRWYVQVDLSDHSL